MMGVDQRMAVLCDPKRLGQVRHGLLGSFDERAGTAQLAFEGGHLSFVLRLVRRHCGIVRGNLHLELPLEQDPPG